MANNRIPHISELTLDVAFPDKFLKAAHLQGHTPVVQIENIKMDVVPMSGGKKAAALIFQFKGKSKEFICNKTNATACSVLFATPQMAQWIGKRIQLVTDIEDDRKTRTEVPCIRIMGSPDASPKSAEEYKRAWRGNRKGGDLCTRLKVSLQRILASGAAAPIEAAPELPPEPADDTSIDSMPEDDWSDDRGEPSETDQTQEPEPAPQPSTQPTEPAPAPVREPGDEEI